MVEEAVREGLQLDPNQLNVGAPSGAGPSIAPNYAAPLFDSRTGLWELERAYHRLEHLLHDARHGQRPPGQSLATSAERRFDDPQLHYSPRAFADYFRDLPRTAVEAEFPPVDDRVPGPKGLAS